MLAIQHLQFNSCRLQVKFKLAVALLTEAQLTEFLKWSQAAAMRYYSLRLGAFTRRAQSMQPEAQSLSSKLPVTHLSKGTRHANAVKQSATSSTTCALAQSLTYAGDAHRHLQ